MPHSSHRMPDTSCHAQDGSGAASYPLCGEKQRRGIQAAFAYLAAMVMVESPPASVAAALVRATQERFGVGPHFARAYLEYWQRTRGRSYAALEEIMASAPPEPMWFEYAMSTNFRAQSLVQHLANHLQLERGRYLDVGCGFGGCLRAFAERGMEVAGIEIDPPRLALSRANAQDGGLGDCVQSLDVLSEDVAMLGR